MKTTKNNLRRAFNVVAAAVLSLLGIVSCQSHNPEPCMYGGPTEIFDDDNDIQQDSTDTTPDDSLSDG